MHYNWTGQDMFLTMLDDQEYLNTVLCEEFLRPKFCILYRK